MTRHLIGDTRELGFEAAARLRPRIAGRTHGPCGRAATGPARPGPAPKTRNQIALVEAIKSAIAAMVHSANEFPKRRNSDYLSQRLSYTYTHLANVFSEVTGSTIEQCIIGHKIDWVKKMLLEGELNLTQISYKLNYSSVAHLSGQFKKVTGLTPTAFKKLNHNRQIVPESVNDVNPFCNCVRGPEIKRVSFVA